MTTTNSGRVLTLGAVVGLLAIMQATMLLSVRQESQTSDEAYSLFAGYLHLTARDFSLCPGYPPLTKDVAALPLLILRPHVPPMTSAEASDFRGGRIFLYDNRADSLLFAARAAMTVFPLLLALLVFWAADEMFGRGPAFIALTLIVFEPNVLAHGPLVTNDVALACCLFGAIFAFWRYAVKPSAGRLALCGVAAGLTLAAKHSGVILFPILVLLSLVAGLVGQPDDRGNRSPSIRRLLVALCGVAAISVAILWSFYTFRYRASPDATAPSPVLAASLGAAPSSLAVKAVATAAHAHLLPEAYLEGWAFFRSTATRPTYLFGKLYAHGVWFYFPAAIAIKSTLGFLLLLALVPVATLACGPGARREALWMLIPAAVYLLASMTSKLNIGLRHVLPVYPFLAVLAAAAGWKLAQWRRAWGAIVGSLVLLHAASSLHAFPNYLAYSNELWGGPSKTYRVLTDSNVDWGQGLPAAERYLETHDSSPCWLAYFGTVDPARYEIPCTLLTTSSEVVWERPLGEVPPELEGTVLVSATEWSGQAWGPGELNPYEPFHKARPVACLAGSILVYRGSFAVPLASALSRLGSAVALANNGKLDAAIARVRAAESLAPRSVDVQFVLGRVLRAAGHEEESRQAFQNALHFARTIEPEWQAYWIPIIQGEINDR